VVDKTPDELTASPRWPTGAPVRPALAGRLRGRPGRAGGQPPGNAQVSQALDRMVDAVKQGRIAGYAAYDPSGRPLDLS
jgi:hypothetical protein